MLFFIKPYIISATILQRNIDIDKYPSNFITIRSKKSDFFYTYVLKTFSRPKKSSNFADKSEFNFQNTIQAV